MRVYELKEVCHCEDKWELSPGLRWCQRCKAAFVCQELMLQDCPTILKQPEPVILGIIQDWLRRSLWEDWQIEIEDVFFISPGDWLKWSFHLYRHSETSMESRPWLNTRESDAR